MRPLVITLGLILSLGLTSAARGQAAATDKPPASPAKPSQGTSLVDLAEKIILASLPEEYEEKKNWGATARVWDGIELRREGRRIETKRRFKLVNDGRWEHVRVSVAPGERPKLEITATKRESDGRIVLTAVARAKLNGYANVMHWQRGIRLYSVSAEGDATVELRLTAEVALKVEGGVLAPALAVQPKMTEAKLDLVDFRLRRVGDLEGSAAKRVGRLLEDAVRGHIDRRGPKIADKMNRSIAKHQDELRLSADEFLKDQWDSVKTRLEAP